jgi:hypothetical protein
MEEAPEVAGGLPKKTAGITIGMFALGSDDEIINMDSLNSLS